MITVAAVAACCVLALLAVFQILLAAGLPLGRFAWGGSHRVLPAKFRIGSAVSVILYALFAVILLDRAQVVEALPETLSSVLIWVLTAYLFVGVLMNAISRSKPERWTMTPVALVLGVLSLAVALS
ncbi:hypothetical protein ACMX2H_17845 [Arthrobacter sulfonylureivorans]|uniref:hypothetical protein n=1 Tax=Arthrobacter sulfonylureivorans TaxID=2486855 RepID=UPI0039E5ADC4